MLSLARRRVHPLDRETPAPVQAESMAASINSREAASSSDFSLSLFGKRITIEGATASSSYSNGGSSSGAGRGRNFVRMGKERSALVDSRKGYISVSDSWYFLLLDSSWRKMLFYILSFYCFCGFAFTLLSLPFVDRILNSSTLENRHASEWETALVFAVTHVVTMGYGQFFPYNRDAERPDLGLFFLASTQQFCGICINVLVFTVVVTKLQHPMPAIVFAQKALVCSRNYQTVLLFRLGNLRCNHIYMPDIRLSMLKKEATVEGEEYMKWVTLKTTEIPMMTATAVVEHVIDETSPLWNFGEVGEHQHPGSFEQNLRSLENNTDFALSLTIMGKDAVYHDDVSAANKYYRDDVVFGSLRFDDVMRPVEDGSIWARLFSEVDGGSTSSGHLIFGRGGLLGFLLLRLPGVNLLVYVAVVVLQLVCKTLLGADVLDCLGQFAAKKTKVKVDFEKLSHLVPASTMLEQLDPEGQVLDGGVSPSSSVGAGGMKYLAGGAAMNGWLSTAPNEHDIQFHHPGPTSIAAGGAPPAPAALLDTTVRQLLIASEPGRSTPPEPDPCEELLHFGQTAPDWCADKNSERPKWLDDGSEFNTVVIFVGGTPFDGEITLEHPAGRTGEDENASKHEQNKSLEFRPHSDVVDQDLPLLPRTGGFMPKSCSFSCCAEIILKAAKIPHRCVCVDVTDKPKWWTDLHKGGATPAIMYQGRFMPETNDVIRFLCREFGESHIRRYLAVPKKDEEAVEAVEGDPVLRYTTLRPAGGKAWAEGVSGTIIPMIMATVKAHMVVDLTALEADATAKKKIAEIDALEKANAATKSADSGGGGEEEEMKLFREKLEKFRKAREELPDAARGLAKSLCELDAAYRNSKTKWLLSDTQLSLDDVVGLMLCSVARGYIMFTWPEASLPFRDYLPEDRRNTKSQPPPAGEVRGDAAADGHDDRAPTIFWDLASADHGANCATLDARVAAFRKLPVYRATRPGGRSEVLACHVLRKKFGAMFGVDVKLNTYCFDLKNDFAHYLKFLQNEILLPAVEAQLVKIDAGGAAPGLLVRTGGAPAAAATGAGPEGDAAALRRRRVQFVADYNHAGDANSDEEVEMKSRLRDKVLEEMRIQKAKQGEYKKVLLEVLDPPVMQSVMIDLCARFTSAFERHTARRGSFNADSFRAEIGMLPVASPNAGSLVLPRAYYTQQASQSQESPPLVQQPAPAPAQPQRHGAFLPLQIHVAGVPSQHQQARQQLITQNAVLQHQEVPQPLIVQQATHPLQKASYENYPQAQPGRHSFPAYEAPAASQLLQRPAPAARAPPKLARRSSATGANLCL